MGVASPAHVHECECLPLTTQRRVKEADGRLRMSLLRRPRIDAPPSHVALGQGTGQGSKLGRLA